MQIESKVLVWSLLCLGLASPASAADWPQFRGPDGSGVAEGERDLPVKFGPEEGLAWSAEVPPGISSPVVAGKRIYLTALRGKDLLTIALDRSTGKPAWERRAPAEALEEVHNTSSPAASTPAADAEGVVVFFGSYGLLAYDADGKERWRAPLGPFKNPFGASSSPILVGPLAILNCDQDEDSFLLAVERATGKVRWRTDRPGFPRGYATPVLWQGSGPGAGARQVVVAGTLRVKGYSVEDGKELWSTDGLARIVNPTPVVGGDFLYVASFSPGGDVSERISMPAFEEYAAAHDGDKDGRLSDPEVPQGDMKNRFRQIDTDKDGFITPAEWAFMARIFEQAKNSIIALRPGAAAEGTAPIAWRHERGIPYVPSPLYFQGRIYMVKDGGIFTALDARSGSVAKQGRLAAGGNYYASPVAGGEHIYCVSRAGEVSVVSSGAEWQVLATNPLLDRCDATPAIADGRLLVRTERKLYCFKASRPADKDAPGGGR